MNQYSRQHTLHPKVPKNVRFLSRDKGVSLVIVLIALILMSLAAVGLVRMVDTSNLVAGNIAFKQGTTSAADRAVEDAIAWLGLPATITTADIPARGYYSTSYTGLDISARSTSTSRVLIDWDDDDCAYAAPNSFITCISPTAENEVSGYSTQYVITRMCRLTGDVNAIGNYCTGPVFANTGDDDNAGDSACYGTCQRPTSDAASPYYRIVVRAKGPRNTVSYTESYVHF